MADIEVVSVHSRNIFMTLVLVLLLDNSVLSSLMSSNGVCDTCVCVPDPVNFVDCSNLHLSAFPGGIPNDTKILHFSGNNLETIGKSTLLEFKQLIELDLSSNELSEPFIVPESLRALYLSFNRLVDLKEILKEAKSLKYLSIKNNRIEVLQTNTFSGSRKIEKLYIASNHIRHLEAGVFNGMVHLKLIDISDNSIVSFYPGIFNGLPSLFSELNFAHMNLKTISSGILSFLHIVTSKIHFNSNKITHLGGNIFYQEHQRQKTTIGTLDFTKNNMRTISETAFAGVAEIKSLFLSRNALTDIPSNLFLNTSIVVTLDLSANNIVSLPNGLFRTCKDLVRLHLFQNSIHRLSPATMEGLISLQSLFVFQNEIDTIEPFTFYNMRLVELYLFSNKLTTIGPDTFNTNNETIRMINLFYNKIASVSDEAFKKMANNASVYISGGSLQQLPPNNVKMFLEGRSFDTKVKVDYKVAQTLRTSGFTCTDDFSTCSICPVGYFGNLKDTGCQPCPSGGFYQDDRCRVSTTRGDIMCKTCNPGTFVPPNIAPGNSTADCYVCPTGTNKSIEAGFRACPCLHGYFRKDRFGPCEICPFEGVDCLKEYQQLKPGFHWLFNHDDVKPATCDIVKLDDYLCFTSNLIINDMGYNKSCTRFQGELPKPLRCPGGRDACPVKDNAVNVTCAVGYEGLLCSQCSHDHYSWFNGCFECPSLLIFVIECIAVLGVFLLFIAIGVWDYKRKEPNQRTVVDILISRAKIILNYYQVIGAIFTSLHSIQWPKRVSSFGSILRILELNIFKLVVKPRCYFPDFHLDVYREYLIGMMFIALIPVFALFVVSTCVLWNRLCIRYNKPQRQFKITQIRQRSYLFVTSMLYITYLSVVNTIMALLPPACDTLCLADGDECCVHRLRDDLSVDCKTEQHQRYTEAGYGSLLYVFGFPLILFLFLFLWRNSKRYDDLQNSDEVNGGDENRNNEDGIENDTTMKYPLYLRFLCGNYKDEFWYWEILELTRKVLQTVLVVLFGSHDSLTLGITTALSVMFLTSHAYFKPMKDKFDNWLQMVSLGAIFFNLLLASMLMIPSPDNVSAGRDVMMAVFLVAVNILVLALALGNFLLVIWRVFKQHRSVRRVAHGRGFNQHNGVRRVAHVSCLSCLGCITAVAGVFGRLFRNNFNTDDQII